MMKDEDKSEIVKIIEERIRETVEDEKEHIQEEFSRLGDKAVERINGVYSSILKAIAGLEIKDPTLLDYIEKTKGNIRVYDNIVGHGPRADLIIQYWGLQLGFRAGEPGITPITLNENKKYRLIVMAIEQGDVKAE